VKHCQPRNSGLRELTDYIRVLRLAKWGKGISLQATNPEPLMSALGQKQTSAHVRVMSAFSPKADIAATVEYD
jgi:hypothetical protein